MNATALVRLLLRYEHLEEALMVVSDELGSASSGTPIPTACGVNGGGI